MDPTLASAGPAWVELLRAAFRILDWLLTYAVHSTLLIGAAWLFTSSSLGRRWRLAAAAGLWRFALIGGMVTATLSVAGAVPHALGTVRLAAPAQAIVHVRVLKMSAGRLGDVLAMTTRVDVAPWWPMVAVAVWLLGAAAGLAFLACAHRRFKADLARGGAASDLAESALRAVLARAGIGRAVSLRVAGGLTSPVAMGRDRICLPRRALAEFDHEHLEGMLAHELAHLERRDAAWLVVARCIEAVCFFQPLNRLARRRMVEAAEFAADAWAAHLTARPVTLARCLARVAEWQVGKAAPAPAMAEGRSSILVRRVRRLTTGVPLRPPARPAWLAAAAAMVALPLLAPRPLIGAAHPAVRRDARQLMIITRDVPGRLPPVLTDQDVVFLHMRRT